MHTIKLHAVVFITIYTHIKTKLLLKQWKTEGKQAIRFSIKTGFILHICSSNSVVKSAVKRKEIIKPQEIDVKLNQLTCNDIHVSTNLFALM